jgi:hypothetical protein
LIQAVFSVPPLSHLLTSRLRIGQICPDSGRRRIQPLSLKQVGAVDSAREVSDPDRAGFQLGRLCLGELHAIFVTGFVDQDGFHGGKISAAIPNRDHTNADRAEGIGSATGRLHAAILASRRLEAKALRQPGPWHAGMNRPVLSHDGGGLRGIPGHRRRVRIEEDGFIGLRR